MDFLTADRKSKADLEQQVRGKGGTVVRLLPGTRVPRGMERPEYVVKDLFQRDAYMKPDAVAVGPLDAGVAFSVSMADIAEVVRTLEVPAAPIRKHAPKDVYETRDDYLCGKCHEPVERLSAPRARWVHR